jgi:hypothetical protein
VLFTTSPEAEEGKSWAIVEADEPAQAVSMVGGRTVAMDDKALCIPLDEKPIPVYATVGWHT